MAGVVMLDARLFILFLTLAFAIGLTISILGKIGKVRKFWSGFTWDIKERQLTKLQKYASFDPVKWYQRYMYLILIVVSFAIISLVQWIIFDIATTQRVPFNTWMYILGLYFLSIGVAVFVPKTFKALILFASKITTVILAKLWFFQRFRNWLGDF